MRGAVGSAGVGGLLLLVAAAFDAEALRVPGLLLAGAGVGSAAWVLVAARGLRVTRHVDRHRVVEDEPLDVRIAVRPRRIPLPGGEVADAALPEVAALPAGWRGTRLRIRVRFARRGRRVLSPTAVVVADPLGLAARRVHGRDEVEVLVLPRLEPVQLVAGGGRDGGRRGRPRAGPEADLDGLRELRDGTPAARIFWPSLARGRPLMERRLRSEGDGRPLVMLDTRSAERPEDVDAAVRAAGSLAVHLARRGGCAVLLPGDRRPTLLEPGLAGWQRLHARLALVEGDQAPNPAAVVPRGGPLVVVAARVGARAPRSLARAPAASRFLVVPGTLPGRRHVLSVAGCNGYHLAPAGARVAPAGLAGAV